MSDADVLRRSAAHVLVDDVDVPALPERTEHHVFRVLRVTDGEVITVTDGRGAWRVCRAAGGGVRPDGEVRRQTPRADPIELFVAIPKQDRPEWLVQKATEIGVDRVVFLHTERSVVRWSAERAERHVGKLTTVAAEAAMQSRRVFLPTIVGPVDAFDVLDTVAVAEPGGRRIATTDRRVAVGPEGGWSDRELSAAGDRVGLGDTVLRVETAALVAATLLVAG